MLSLFNLFFQFTYPINLSKKTQKLKIAKIVKNSENSKKLDQIESSKTITEGNNKELDIYFYSLPRSIKYQARIDFFSSFWLQKVGRTDLCYCKENNQTFLDKIKEKNDKDISKYYLKKKATLLNSKNKSKISLGSVVEEKILNYSKKSGPNDHFLYVNIKNQKTNSNLNEIIKLENVNNIKINKIELYELRNKIKFIISFVIFISTAYIYAF